MLQLIIKFVVQNLLKSAGPFLAANGIATAQEWQTVLGVLTAAVGWIWHWHETHAAAVAAGKVSPASTPPASAIAPLVALFLIPAFLIAGCSTSANKMAYRVTGSTQIGADAAMTEWGAYVKAFHPPASQEQAVKAAYEKYQSGAVVVCDAGAAYASAVKANGGDTTVPTVTAAWAALQTAVSNRDTEISDMESLMTNFGVTLH